MLSDEFKLHCDVDKTWAKPFLLPLQVKRRCKKKMTFSFLWRHKMQSEIVSSTYVYLHLPKHVRCQSSSFTPTVTVDSYKTESAINYAGSKTHTSPKRTQTRSIHLCCNYANLECTRFPQLVARTYEINLCPLLERSEHNCILSLHDYGDNSMFLIDCHKV